MNRFAAVIAASASVVAVGCSQQGRYMPVTVINGRIDADKDSPTSKFPEIEPGILSGPSRSSANRITSTVYSFDTVTGTYRLAKMVE